MIWKPRRLTRTQLDERRLAAGRLLQAGRRSHVAIARQMGVSRTAVSRWAKQLRHSQGDLRSLKNRPMPGRPPRLSAETHSPRLEAATPGSVYART
jgi:putative transposase